MKKDLIWPHALEASAEGIPKKTTQNRATEFVFENFFFWVHLRTSAAAPACRRAGVPDYTLLKSESQNMKLLEGFSYDPLVGLKIFFPGFLNDLFWQFRCWRTLVPSQGKEVISQELFVKTLLRTPGAVFTLWPEP